jgi:2-polyprenyl-6-methoxyphenol hydroxylase-like FAD-dependent oxidoreductase
MLRNFLGLTPEVSMTTTPETAVVVGGSVAGLAAAATLSPRARRVLVVERRPATGGSVAPQGVLPHVMLAAGARSLERLFPGFAEELRDHGAGDAGEDPEVLPCRWVAGGATRDHLRLPDLGFRRALCGRRLIEDRLRARVRALPNVELLDGSVSGVRWTGAGSGLRAAAVQVDGQAVEADLVVDAGGRTSHASAWLAATGVPAPAVTEVGVDLRYTGIVVERRPGDIDGAGFVVVQNDASLSRIGVALMMERDRWHLVLGGYFGDAAPTDPAGARAFARSLRDPVLAEVLDRPFLEPPTRYTFRSSLRRHWEDLTLPGGLCVVGDAVASFNPLYGQGMTSALLQVEALGRELDRQGNTPTLPGAVARQAAKLVANPWLTATGADFVYAATRGKRPPGTAFVNRYVDRVTAAAARDEEVNRAFTAVQQMLAPPASLFAPAVMVRTLGHRRARPRTATTPTGSVAPAA